MLDGIFEGFTVLNQPKPVETSIFAIVLAGAQVLIVVNGRSWDRFGIDEPDILCDV